MENSGQRRAVVLGGGGSRGPYQVGVWQALLELDIDYQIVTGTSVGAINGALMVQQDFALAKSMWESLTTKDVILDAPEPSENPGKTFLELLRQARGKGGLDVSPLENTLRRAVDEERVRTSEIAFGIVTVQYPSFRPVKLLKEEIPQGKLLDYLLASASYYPFFQRKEIGGVSYVDGGYSDILPTELALRCGAREIIAVDLAALGIIRPLRAEIPVTYIHSYWDLGQLFIFEAETAKRNLRLGYQDGMKAFRALEGHAYAFYTGETAKNARRLLPALDNISKKTGVSLLHANDRLPQLQDMLRARPPRSFRKKEGPPTLGRTVTAAAEITAELLGVPPDAVYTFERLNRLLVEYSAPLYLAPPESGGALVPSQPEKRRKSRPALHRLTRWLNGAYETGRVPERFWALAALFPREFVAASYLLALRLSAAPELRPRRPA